MVSLAPYGNLSMAVAYRKICSAAEVSGLDLETLHKVSFQDFFFHSIPKNFVVARSAG